MGAGVGPGVGVLGAGGGGAGWVANYPGWREVWTDGGYFYGAHSLLCAGESCSEPRARGFVLCEWGEDVCWVRRAPAEEKGAAEEGEGELLEGRGGRDKLGRQVRAGETRTEQARVRERRQNGRAVRGASRVRRASPARRRLSVCRSFAATQLAWRRLGRRAGGRAATAAASGRECGETNRAPETGGRATAEEISARRHGERAASGRRRCWRCGGGAVAVLAVRWSYTCCDKTVVTGDADGAARSCCC